LASLIRTVRRPQPFEFGTDRPQPGHQFRHVGVARPPRGGRPQIGDVPAGQPVPIGVGERLPAGRIGEPAPQQVAIHAGEAGVVTHHVDVHAVLREDLAEIRHHAGGRVLQLVQQVEQPGSDVPVAAATMGRRMSAQVVEMVALVVGEPQCAGECAENLHRGPRAPRLFETGVVVGGHPGEQGDLVATQAGSPAAGTGQQSHIGGL
jgi:hypothetical protein